MTPIKAKENSKKKNKMFTKSFSNTTKKKNPGSAPVFLNVYGLTPINGYAYWLGLGVYHSGIQVHGVEYAYGAHENPMTGIFEGVPKQCPGFSFRKSIMMGSTNLGAREVRILMDELAAEYTGNSYNLISKNCNHFCNQACLLLTGKSIPRWVNRLAKIGFLCNCVLPVPMEAVRSKGEEEEKGKSEAERRKLRSNSTCSVRSTTSNSSLLASKSWNGGKIKRSSSMSASSGLKV